MHCWHQRVRIERPGPTDKYGDIEVDTNKSFEVYKEWLKMTRPAPGPNGERRPLWFKRPLRPMEEAYFEANMDEKGKVKDEILDGKTISTP
jgi:hypothetical protein